MSGRTQWPSPARLLLGLGVVSGGLLLAGILSDDPAPVAPAGRLVPGTVLGSHQGRTGPYAMVRVDVPDGPVFCGIHRDAFRDGRIPPEGTEITVDYVPAGRTECADARTPEPVPRWSLVGTGVGGLLLTLCLWYAGSHTPRAKVRIWRTRFRSWRRRPH